MGKKEFEKYLSRRILSDEGWTYFCRICGEYKPENDFYTNKKGGWGMDTRCKLHYKKDIETPDHSMDYLKLDPLKEDDFICAQQLLEKLGYKFGPDEISVHEQFKQKHNI